MFKTKFLLTDYCISMLVQSLFIFSDILFTDLLQVLQINILWTLLFLIHLFISAHTSAYGILIVLIFQQLYCFSSRTKQKHHLTVTYMKEKINICCSNTVCIWHWKVPRWVATKIITEDSAWTSHIKWETADVTDMLLITNTLIPGQVNQEEN